MSREDFSGQPHSSLWAVAFSKDSGGAPQADIPDIRINGSGGYQHENRGARFGEQDSKDEGFIQERRFGDPETLGARGNSHRDSRLPI